ncbi:MAG: beta-ketoacyl-ACP synthase II [Chloroflexota bacterium]|nr:beta-ketoacyl-ACP synthase II [Chloroflexota bacterium]
MERQVVVTGLGAVTPVGNDVPSTWDALVEGRSGVGPITCFDASEFSTRIGAEVKDFDPATLFGHREARRMDRFTQFALAAAEEALRDAELSADEVDNGRIGVIIGTGIGGVATLLEQDKVLRTRGTRRVSPFTVPMIMPNAAAAQVAITYGFTGPNFSVISACATGTNAIGEAAAIIHRGDAEVIICGGGEAPLVPVAIAGFCSMGALSSRNDEPKRASRPFDAERDGFVPGEGGGILILESREHAEGRGARIYAEVIGYGMTSDAAHITAPDEEGRGAAEAMRLALSSAGLNPEEVDYINAHGTSTALNDKTETRAIRTVFGKHADRLAVSSSKSMIGHLMGAAGAVESIATIKALETGVVHPTINYEHPDPECDLDYVPNQARRINPRVALSNSFGFGGHNACLAFRKLEI